MAGSSPALYLGTRGGLFRWQEGVVAPITSGSDPVTALLTLTGNRVLAGTQGGRVLRFGAGGRIGPLPDPISAAALAALALVPGTRRIVAATADGTLHVSDDFGATFRARGELGAGAPIDLVGVPTRPESLLAFAPDGVFLSADGGTRFSRWSEARPGRAVATAAHPYDPKLWLLATRHGLLRSLDGAQSFRSVDAPFDELRARVLRFAALPPHRLYLLAEPARLPVEPRDPSPLWWSDDAGRTFVPVASNLIDRPRDPSGEITALAVWRDHDRTIVGLGTDRGELLVWRGGDGAAELVADGLPPVVTMAAVAAAHALDPSTSGIFLLP